MQWAKHVHVDFEFYELCIRKYYSVETIPMGMGDISWLNNWLMEYRCLISGSFWEALVEEYESVDPPTGFQGIE